jgi:hypothetical protein
MLRRLTLTAVASLTLLSAAAPAATAANPFPVPLPPLPVNQLRGHWQDRPSEQTRLTVTVSRSGNPTADGTFELACDPAGGNHPSAQRACDRLAEAAQSGQNPFAPTAAGTMCTQQAGGPAAARVQGMWRGQALDAHFSQANGCEISRWDNLVPVLPSPR